ncbi:MAG: hypothetical protein AAB696_01275 [Patescibacteria group bacterium]
MNKIIIAIIVVVVVALSGYFFLKGAYQTAAPVIQPLPQSPTEQAPVAENNNPVAENNNVVIYTDAGYTQNSLQIKAGETVIFKNQSSRVMWTASAAHPTHRVYPTTGGCIGSTFDACKGIQLGDSWSFRFDIKGTWKYHDHLTPGNFGAIIVQ